MIAQLNRFAANSSSSNCHKNLNSSLLVTGLSAEVWVHERVDGLGESDFGDVVQRGDPNLSALCGPE